MSKAIQWKEYKNSKFKKLMRRVPETHGFSYLQREAYIHTPQTLSLEGLPHFKDFGILQMKIYLFFLDRSLIYPTKSLKEYLGFFDQENVPK